MTETLSADRDESANILAIEGLAKSFGEHSVLRSITLRIRENDIHAIIGPNGAGKTTLINLITGVHSPSSGNITFADEDVTFLSVHKRARRGLSRTFQITNLFSDLTTLENVEVSLVASRKYRSKLSTADQSPSTAGSLLDLVGLPTTTRNKRAESLSHGDQRLLEVAVAMASRPRLLLLDEPSAGMSPSETMSFVQLVNSQLRGRTTILIVEHDMAVVMGTADRISVLAEGRVLADGAPREIMENAYVREAYLGHA